ARAKADWLVGLNVTRALTVKYQDSLAAGRVQTPTLALVRKQEQKIEAFRPIQYFQLIAHYQEAQAELQQKNPYQWQDRRELEQFVNQLAQAKPQVTSITEKEKIEPAPLPYDLTELQREANQRYQFSAKKTL